MRMVVVVMYNDEIRMINTQQLCEHDDHHKLRFGLPNPYLSPGLAQVQIDIINNHQCNDMNIFEILSIVLILITLMLLGKQAW